MFKGLCLTVLYLVSVGIQTIDNFIIDLYTQTINVIPLLSTKICLLRM